MSKIYLAVDNCFASKRWVTPDAWARILADFGIRYVEASADVELDPLHMEHTYLMRWEQQAREALERHGMEIATFFSGHGTYTTTGLLHPDEGTRRRIRELWIGEAARRAGRFGAGLGFFVHAIPQEDLEERERYQLRRSELIGELSLIAELAGSVPDLTTAAVEQMYTPHQPPWRIDEALRFMSEVFERSDGYPLYTALDLGHGGPQRHFLRPRREELSALLAEYRNRGREPGADVWLGGAPLRREFVRLAGERELAEDSVIERFETKIDDQGHLFAAEEDSDPYNWLESVGPYAPIVHLQQTDGQSSRHLPFTRAENERGVVEPKKVLEALQRGFRALKASERASKTAIPGDVAALPRPVDKIYLTLELFTGTAAYPEVALRELEDSISYWREIIPEDGRELEELL